MKMPKGFKKELTISYEFVCGLKEVLRTAIFAAIPNIILWVQNDKIEMKVLATGVVVAVLSGISEWMHKEGKKREFETEKKSVLTKGLSRI